MLYYAEYYDRVNQMWVHSRDFPSEYSNLETLRENLRARPAQFLRYRIMCEGVELEEHAARAIDNSPSPVLTQPHPIPSRVSYRDVITVKD